MLRDRKHARIRWALVAWTVASTSILASGQLLQFNDNALPECAFQCAPLYHARFDCDATFESGEASKDQWRCFCQNQYVLNISSGNGTSECDIACTGEDAKRTNGWIKEQCDIALDRLPKNVTNPIPGIGTRTPVPTNTRTSASRTSSPTATETSGNTAPEESNSEDPNERPLIAKIWPYIVLGFVILLLPLLAFLLYRYLRPYLRRRAIAIEAGNRASEGGAGGGFTALSPRRSVFRRSRGRSYTTVPIPERAPQIPDLSTLAKEATNRASGSMDGRRTFSGETLMNEDLEAGLVPPKKPMMTETIRSVSSSPPAALGTHSFGTSPGSFGTPNTGSSPYSHASPQSNAQEADGYMAASSSSVALIPNVTAPVFANMARSSSSVALIPPVPAPIFTDGEPVRGTPPPESPHGSRIPVPAVGPMPVVAKASPSVNRSWSWDTDQVDEDDHFQVAPLRGGRPALVAPVRHPVYYETYTDYEHVSSGLGTPEGSTPPVSRNLRVVNRTPGVTPGTPEENPTVNYTDYFPPFDPNTHQESQNEGPQLVDKDDSPYYDDVEMEAMLGMGLQPHRSLGYPVHTPLHTLMEVDEEGLSRESSMRRPGRSRGNPMRGAGQAGPSGH